ncbi:MAG: hypothetical protein GX640_13450 [Fibrobacter sp.]|nr:hypothetical protein [Fibrobacter sp.]
MERPLESGVSIVEICVAILMIAVTGIIIMSFTKTTFSSYRDSRLTESASMVAEDKLCELDAAAFPPSNGQDTIFVDDQRYIRSWEILDTGLIKRAIVTVNIQTINGVKEIRLTGAID